MSDDLNASPPDDIRLSAWLDGELPAADAQAISRWLESHPEDAARARLWAADREALRVRLDALLHEPLPEALVDAVWHRETGAGPKKGVSGMPWWRRNMPLALAASFVAGMGLTLAVSALRPGAPEAAVSLGSAWPQRAMVAHAVYVPEQRHPVEVSTRRSDGSEEAAQEAHLSAWLTKRLGRPVGLFDLREQGYALMGGRLLPADGGPGAQLMYEDSAGTRVTVYLQVPERAETAGHTENTVQFRYAQRDGYGQFYWVEGAPGQETGYALVGALPKVRLLALAEAIDRQIRAGDR